MSASIYMYGGPSINQQSRGQSDLDYIKAYR